MNPPTFTYDTLTRFPLRWRWTRASHDVFTADELACVHPLDEASARLAHAHVRELRDTGRGSRERTIELDEAHREDVRGWLDRLGVTPGTPVVLSWSATIAVEITWALFVSRWSAFWYPSSDQLSVFACSGDWLLEISETGTAAWMSASGA